MVAQERSIGDIVACRVCQGMGEPGDFYRIKKSFTSTAPGRHTVVTWRPPLTVRLVTNPSAKELTEWSYTDHFMLAHPEVRGAYIRACLVHHKIERAGQQKPGSGKK
jgi:hypothetical protein